MNQSFPLIIRHGAEAVKCFLSKKRDPAIKGHAAFVSGAPRCGGAGGVCVVCAKRVRTVATWARVALPVGSSDVLLTPLRIPAAAAHDMAFLA